MRSGKTPETSVGPKDGVLLRHYSTHANTWYAHTNIQTVIKRMQNCYSLESVWIDKILSFLFCVLEILSFTLSDHSVIFHTCSVSIQGWLQGQINATKTSFLLKYRRLWYIKCVRSEQIIWNEKISYAELKWKNTFYAFKLACHFLTFLLVYI